MAQARGDAGLSDLVLKEGVLRFDGDVVEVFGFIYENSTRMHITQLTELDYDGKDKLKIKADPGKYIVVRFNDEDEPQRGDFENLLEEIRSAAPKLKEA